MPLYLYDDATARDFEPFTLTRPVSELVAGAELIRQRWESVCGEKAAGFIASRHLRYFDEAGAPHSVPSDTTIAAGSLLANSRFIPAIGSNFQATATQVQEASAFHCGDEICAVRIAKPVPASELADGTLPLSALAHGAGMCTTKGRWVGAIWDLVTQLGDQLSEDIPHLAQRLSIESPGDATVIGTYGVFREAGAHLDPYVMLDARAGPILIRAGATISSFSRIVGPCYIGPHAIVVGDDIRACSIGDTCKVRGEISNTIMLGYANKGHTGFVGHSYLGRWVNLGSGSTTSNLKNTYGTIQMWTPSGMQETGAQFLGTLFGDHVKTGIGTLLRSGVVLGMGANIFGGNIRSKYVPPFSWGNDEPYDSFELSKFVEVARRMMARREVEMSADGARQLEDAHTVAMARES